MLSEQGHYIFYNWYLDLRAGGPTGYLANLKSGIEKQFGKDYKGILFAVKQRSNLPEEKKNKSFKEILLKNNLFNYIYVNYFSKKHAVDLEKYSKFLEEVFKWYPDKETFGQIDLEKVKTIHVHSVDEVIKIKNILRDVGEKKIKIVLTCHVPESVGLEYFHGKLEEGYKRERVKNILEGWQKVEIEAYKQADILVFPSREAMSPAIKFVPGFTEIIKEKDIRFVPTGVEEISLIYSKEEAKKKYGVHNKFVFGFLGRHNSIKGYDILKKAAKKILEKNRDVVFLIGGVQGREYKPLRNKRWIECGLVEPKEFLAAVDVFVLPNRMTYYDLILLEVMSCGVPIVASHTGGTISVKKDVPEIVTYEKECVGLVEKLQDMYHAPESKREEIGKALRKAYLEKFSVECFAQNYAREIERIHNDYNL